LTDIGEVLHAHVAALFPLCRSITGAGLRATLRYIGGHIPLRISEVPTGTAVLDWEIPPEWRVRGATLSTLDGRTLVDFSRNNLHLLQYSTPVDRIVPRDELQAHLHSLPDQPELIPYRTSYYARNWGFCLADRARQALTDDAYRVRIDTSLEPGSLTYGECFLPGETEQEVLISAHCCHPSLANDNLSSIAVAIELARALAMRPHHFSYRFLFAPGTIGAIAWLHFNRDARARVAHGLVLTCLGDPAPPSYKRSRQGAAAIDRYAEYVLREAGNGDRIIPFAPTGYDERQFCSPGFDLPMGCLMRSPGGGFPEYHTSGDNPSLVTGDAMADSLDVLRRILELAERDRTLRNTSPYGEPQLGRRGLYDGERAAGLNRMAVLWVLNQSDGRHSLLDIAELAGIPFSSIAAAADALCEVGLLARTDAHEVRTSAADAA
jgi:aminopeptidase-like protein